MCCRYQSWSRNVGDGSTAPSLLRYTPSFTLATFTDHREWYRSSLWERHSNLLPSVIRSDVNYSCISNCFTVSRVGDDTLSHAVILVWRIHRNVQYHLRLVLYRKFKRLQRESVYVELTKGVQGNYYIAFVRHRHELIDFSRKTNLNMNLAVCLGPVS